MSRIDQFWQYVKRLTLTARRAEWQNQRLISDIIDFDQCDLAVLAVNVILSAHVCGLRRRA